MVSGIGESALALLRAPGPPPAEVVLTVLLNDLAAVAGDIVLVLDDYHVIDAPLVQGGMGFLLDHLPPRLDFGYRAAGRIRCCRWPGCGRAASWPRSARLICVSPRRRRRRT